MAGTRWLTDDELQLWLNFLGAGAVVDRRLNQELKKAAGLSHVQYEILMRLYRTPGGQMHMNELADALYDSKSGVTYQVTQLERAGFVQRQPCEHHERGVHAVLTDEGRRKLKSAVPGHLTTVRKLIMDALTPEEREVLTEALGKIIQQADS